SGRAARLHRVGRGFESLFAHALQGVGGPSRSEVRKNKNKNTFATGQACLAALGDAFVRLFSRMYSGAVASALAGHGFTASTSKHEFSGLQATSSHRCNAMPIPLAVSVTAPRHPSHAMTAPISAQALLAFASSRAGDTFHTLTRKVAFSVAVSEGCIVFTPQTTNKSRRQTNDRIEAVCREFNASGSLRPGNYADISFDASYILALIHAAESPSNHKK
ncbi:MAG: hypothetical protein JWO94_971, partial [Verrucomicrobiaceae bacterium]|nr:hypothetical protein [Verrucomicrobiaceae bacterium]